MVPPLFVITRVCGGGGGGWRCRGTLKSENDDFHNFPLWVRGENTAKKLSFSSQLNKSSIVQGRFSIIISVPTAYVVIDGKIRMFGLCLRGAAVFALTSER